MEIIKVTLLFILLFSTCYLYVHGTFVSATKPPTLTANEQGAGSGLALATSDDEDAANARRAAAAAAAGGGLAAVPGDVASKPIGGGDVSGFGDPAQRRPPPDAAGSGDFRPVQPPPPLNRLPLNNTFNPIVELPVSSTTTAASRNAPAVADGTTAQPAAGGAAKGDANPLPREPQQPPPPQPPPPPLPNENSEEGGR